MIDVTRDEFNIVKAEIVEMREQLSAFHDESKAVAHLVVGGINAKTGLVDRGVVQSLDELVTQMKATAARFDAVANGARRFAVNTARWVMGIIGTGIAAIVTWYVHNLSSSITVQTIHSTTTVVK